MPLSVAPLIALALGAVLSAANRGSMTAREAEVARRAVSYLAALCFFPVVAFSALSEPAWSVGYLTDAARWPPVLLLVAAALASALVPLGRHLGEALGAGRNPGGALERRLALAAAPAVAAIVVLVVQSDPLSVVGPHLAFTRGSERALTPLSASRFGAALLSLDALLVLACALTARGLAGLGAPPVGPRARFGRPKLGRGHAAVNGELTRGAAAKRFPG